jgi:hypothetical protein
MIARTDDYDAIVRVVQLYVDAFNENDISKLREAFHEDAWIFYIDADGTLHKNLISESFERWASPPSWGVVGRFISVTQVGDAATVIPAIDTMAPQFAPEQPNEELESVCAPGRSVGSIKRRQAVLTPPALHASPSARNCSTFEAAQGSSGTAFW